MRRFVRTYFARKKAQAFIIQDGRDAQFEVWLWAAADHGGPVLVSVHPYKDTHDAIDVARTVAIKAARTAASSQIDGEAPLTAGRPARGER